jgi:flagellar biosynthetic protein FliP
VHALENAYDLRKSGLMAIDMSVGMAAWMRYRGHGWTGTLEMCAAMFVPLALLPLVGAGLMGVMSFMTAAHVVMLAAMLVVLLRRRREFAHC